MRYPAHHRPIIPSIGASSVLKLNIRFRSGKRRDVIMPYCSPQLREMRSVKICPVDPSFVTLSAHHLPSVHSCVLILAIVLKQFPPACPDPVDMGPCC